MSREFWDTVAGVSAWCVAFIGFAALGAVATHFILTGIRVYFSTCS